MMMKYEEKNMRRKCNERVENVDFEKLRQCLKNHGIKQRELSIVCGYYPDYIEANTLRKRYLNKHVSNVLTYAYKVDPSEYIVTQPKEVISTKDNEQLALRIDKDLIEKFRNWAFYNRFSQKEAMEKILSEYLDGKKTATTISEDDTAEATISNNDITKATASNDEQAERPKKADKKKKSITFALRIDPDMADAIKRYAFLKNKKIKDVMEEIIVEQLEDVKLPEREEAK